MINGHGSKGSVILRIAEDFETHGHRGRLHRFSFNGFVETVVGRRRSIASARGHHPSYLWWYIGRNSYGEIEPVIDTGGLARRALQKRRVSKSYAQPLWRYHWPLEMIDDNGCWGAVLEPASESGYDGRRSPGDIMLQEGLNFGQRILSRTYGHWTDPGYYGDEAETVYRTEIIYADPCHLIDIPVTVDNFLSPPTFKGLQVA